MAGFKRFIVRDSDGKVRHRTSEGLTTDQAKAEADEAVKALTEQHTDPETSKASESFTVEQYLPQ